MLDAHALHLVVRWLHVAAMATAFGGAVLVAFLASRSVQGAIAPNVLSQAAIGYEWIFWAAAGVLAMTGVGNLAALGLGLPEPTTSWGTTLQLKLDVVLALVAISLPRTLAVATLSDMTRAPRVLSRIYATTALLFAIVLALAITLAHA
jgi:hypothetical protein